MTDRARRHIRIACVYRFDDEGLVAASMDRIRFRRMAEALARAGYRVDLIARKGRIQELAPNLRRVPVSTVRWDRYDIIKTSIHRGFGEVMRRGGGEHPFIVASLGSVVGTEPRPGVHFHGDIHRELVAIQTQVAERARAVTLLTDENERAWTDTHGFDMLRMRVPTGVDAVVPDLGPDPYRPLGLDGRAVLFAGNVYGDQQLEVNAIWVDRLNRLGRALRKRGLHLVAMGTGRLADLDRSAVTHVGVVSVEETWDWQRHAIAGVVLAHGPIQDNESSKIYYYLRTELPVLCESPVPNRWLVDQTGLGAIVPLDDVEAMADAAVALAGRPRLENGVAHWMASEHSWDERAARYESLFEQAPAAHSRRLTLRPRSLPRRSRTAQIALLSPGLAERSVWGERLVLQGLARALPRAFPGANVELIDVGQLASLADHRVDLLVSLCTGPRPPWRADDVARYVDGIALLWVVNHPELLSEFTSVEVDGYLSNSPKAVDVLASHRPTAWCPLGVDPAFRRVAARDRYRADVIYLGSGGIGNKNPETTHRYLDPAKAFDFAIWGSNWSSDYWSAVHPEAAERNDWHRFWRGPLPVGDEAALYSSAGVVLGYHEDGQREWGMWNNRVFETLAAEALLISDDATGLADAFGEAVAITSGGSETAELIERFLADPAERARRGALGRKLVMASYTYDHAAGRIRDLYVTLSDAKGARPARTAPDAVASA